MENKIREIEEEELPLECVFCGIKYKIEKKKPEEKKKDFPQIDGLCGGCDFCAKFDSIENVFTKMRNLRSPEAF